MGSPDSFLAGIEFGGTKTICAIGSVAQGIVDERRLATQNPETTLGEAIAYFRAQQRRQNLLALGIASFGPLDLERRSSTFGFITSTPKPGWAGTDLVRRFKNALKIPVFAHTDVAAAALAEHEQGAGRGADDIVYLTIGTGIGGAPIVRGRLLVSKPHPELGHIPVSRVPGDRFGGSCVFHGACLEGMASGSAISARTGCSAELLPRGHRVWSFVVEYLAQGLAAYTYILAPSRIVVGGGIILGSKSMLPLLKAKLERRMAGYQEPPNIDSDYLVKAELGQQAGVYGALLLASLGLRGRCL